MGGSTKYGGIKIGPYGSCTQLKSTTVVGGKYRETDNELVSYQPPSPKGEGAEVSKMAIRVWAGGYAPRPVLTKFRVGVERVKRNRLHTINVWGLEVLNPNFQPNLM